MESGSYKGRLSDSGIQDASAPAFRRLFSTTRIFRSSVNAAASLDPECWKIRKVCYRPVTGDMRTFGTVYFSGSGRAFFGGLALSSCVRSLFSLVATASASAPTNPKIVSRTVHRLEEKGWVSSKWETAPDRNREFKYYRLTEKGREQLLEEESRWKQMTEAVVRVMWPAADESGDAMVADQEEKRRPGTRTAFRPRTRRRRATGEWRICGRSTLRSIARIRQSHADSRADTRHLVVGLA
jgi:hypothetical protein